MGPSLLLAAIAVGCAGHTPRFRLDRSLQSQGINASASTSRATLSREPFIYPTDPESNLASTRTLHLFFRQGTDFNFQYMYNPMIETLQAGAFAFSIRTRVHKLEDAVSTDFRDFINVASFTPEKFFKEHKRTTLSANPNTLLRHFAEANPGDVLVWVGMQGEDVNWANLRKLGFYTVYYTLEPLVSDSRFCESTHKSAWTADEIWTYSKSNVDYLKTKCLPAMSQITDREMSDVRIRYVPSGYQYHAPFIPQRKDFESQVLFLGGMAGERKECWANIVESFPADMRKRLGTRFDIFSHQKLLELCKGQNGSSVGIFLNFHRDCKTKPLQAPLEPRITQLLSSQALIISQPCHPLDQSSFQDLVDFVSLEDMGRVGVTYMRNVSLEEREGLAKERFQIFRDRFHPWRIFANANIPADLFGIDPSHTPILDPPPKPDIYFQNEPFVVQVGSSEPKASESKGSEPTEFKPSESTELKASEPKMSESTEPRKGEGDTTVFYGVYVEKEGSWKARTIAQEQIRYVLSSPVRERIRSIRYFPLNQDIEIAGCSICEKSTRATTENGKQKRGYRGDVGAFQEIVLQDMYEYCIAHPHQRVIYIHSKGSFRYTKNNNILRRALMYSLFSRECSEKASNLNCNLCGMRYTPFPFPRYPGNMFWANCTYISKLVNPVDMSRLAADAMREWNQTRIQLAPWTYGSAEFSTHHWVTSHPDVVPCDVYSRMYTSGRQNLPSEAFRIQILRPLRFPPSFYHGEEGGGGNGVSETDIKLKLNRSFGCAANLYGFQEKLYGGGFGKDTWISKAY